MHFHIDEPEPSEQVPFGDLVSFPSQPFRDYSCDCPKTLTSPPLGLDESIVQVEDNSTNLPLIQSLSIPDICFWPAISEPFFTQSRMKAEIDILNDNSFSLHFEHVHPRVRYFHLRILLETDNNTVSRE